MADMTKEEREGILALAEQYERDVREDEAWRGGGNTDSAPTKLVQNRIKRNATIARALRLLAEGEKGEPVAVKPLEWQGPSYENNGCWTAKSPLGTYSIVNEGGWHASRDDTPRDFYFEWSSQDMSRDTLHTAQAAAQADYEARVRSALVASPTRSYAEGDPIRSAAIDWHQAGQDLHAAVVEGRSTDDLRAKLHLAEERLNMAIRALAPKEG